jgi:hypothetical protein
MRGLVPVAVVANVKFGVMVTVMAGEVEVV